MRTVADQVQFVVQIVFTTSSNTLGLRIIRPAPFAAQLQVRVARGDLVERPQVLVEAEHVRHGRAQVGHLRPTGEHLHLRVPLAALGDEHRRRRAPAGREGQLERPRLLVDPVRRQVGDAVGGDRAAEVDRLPARAPELDLRRASRHLPLQRRDDRVHSRRGHSGRRRRRNVHGRGPRRRRTSDDRQGADGRAPGGVRARGRARRSEPRRSSGSRTGRPRRRMRCWSTREPAQRSWRRPASSICSTCAARRARICTGCATTIPSRSCRSSGASESRSAWGRTACSRPLDLSTLPEIDAEAVAVCLLFSFARFEARAGGRVGARRRLPGARIVASHEIAPEFREYERASTTAIDAYSGLRSRAISRRWRGAARGGLAGAVGDAFLRWRRFDRGGGCASGVRAALGAGGGRGRGGDRRSRRPGSRTPSLWTWAERRPTSR